jgi:hypothetical protein
MTPSAKHVFRPSPGWVRLAATARDGAGRAAVARRRILRRGVAVASHARRPAAVRPSRPRRAAAAAVAVEAAPCSGTLAAQPPRLAASRPDARPDAASHARAHPAGRPFDYDHPRRESVSAVSGGRLGRAANRLGVASAWPRRAWRRLAVHCVGTHTGAGIWGTSRKTSASSPAGGGVVLCPGRPVGVTSLRVQYSSP